MKLGTKVEFVSNKLVILQIIRKADESCYREQRRGPNGIASRTEAHRPELPLERLGFIS